MRETPEELLKTEIAINKQLLRELDEKNLEICKLNLQIKEKDIKLDFLEKQLSEACHNKEHLKLYEQGLNEREKVLKQESLLFLDYQS